jgi:cytochrome c biogenesis protein CcmG/thiol:disulfide interchange protein DsbE
VQKWFGATPTAYTIDPRIEMSDITSPPPASSRDKWLGRLPAIAFLLVACWFYRRTTAYSAPRHVEFSSLALTSLDGSQFPAEKLRDKAVMINFWAPWCGPCRSEIPWLQQLQAEHRDLVIIGIEDDPEVYPDAMILASSAGISYPLVRTSKNIRATFGRVMSLPTTLYISRSGKVLHTVSGLIPETLMNHYAQDTIAAE